MTILRLLLIALLIGSLSGCAWQQQAGFDRWLGQSRDALMQGIGMPDRCAALKDGGEICEWRFPTGEITNYTMDRADIIRAWTTFHPRSGRHRSPAPVDTALEAAR